MRIRGTEIIDTFAEAFPMVGTRLVITAASPYWADVAAREATGYGTSVIACDAECGVERTLDPGETPDGRPGVACLLFGFSRDKLAAAVAQRVGQCVMTCPTTACYDGLPEAEKKIRVGGHLRFFGDGFQTSKLLEEPLEDGRVWRRRLWRIPVMDGEFVCEESVGTQKGVGGGNFLVQATHQEAALAAVARALAAIEPLPDVITPFPGGVVRSGSKVGSKYKQLRASTNDAYCPTLRGLVRSALAPEAHCVYEIVIDGLSEAAVRRAMRAGIMAACGPGVVAISAGNYGGKLGPFHFHLHRVLDGT